MQQPFILLGLATLLAIPLLVVYRLAAHPLARFPGPRLAAVSGLFLFYYDVVLGGKLHLELQRLHARYGPIIRIGPNELHVCHPGAYDQVYRVGSKASKWPWYYSCFGVGHSAFGTLDNTVHNQRRAAMSSFFSRQSVLAFDEVLSRPIIKLRARLRLLQQQQGPDGHCPLERAYRCISLDSISEIAFGSSFGFLDMDDYGKSFHEGVEDSLRTICTIRHFPILVPVFNNIPLWLMRMAGEKLSAVRMMKEFAQKAASTALSPDAANSHTKGTRQTNAKTIVAEIVSNPDPSKTGVVTRRRLEEEALSLIAASSDTVGNALTVATYHLLKNEFFLRRLEEELKGVIPDVEKCPGYDELADLPWLTAVVKESLRMSHGLVGRLPRVVPLSGMEVLGERIPGGTVISMSAYLQHTDPRVFPEPDSFMPQRWLDQGDGPKNLNRYLVAFGKGSHNCIGSTMAYSLLYKSLATIHRSFGLRIQGPITDADMAYEDRFVGLHARDACRLAVSVEQVYA